MLLKVKSNLNVFREYSAKLGIVENLEDQIKGMFNRDQIGFEDDEAYFRFDIYGSCIHVDVSGMFLSSPSEVVNSLNAIFGFGRVEKGHKFRYNGNRTEEGYSCETPFDEWYLIPTVKDQKIHVALTYRQSYEPDDTYYAVSMSHFPVPGYLVAAYEKEEQVKKRTENYPPSKPIYRPQPMLLGPEEISLCREKED